MKTVSLIVSVSAALVCTSMAASVIAQTAAPALPGDADGAFVVSSKFSEPDGAKMYKRVCAGCHMPDAKGAVGAGFYPALARNQKLGASTYPVYVVVKGMNGMPAVGAMMTDQQVADVVNYLRSNFGNRYRDAVKAADVQALR